MALTSINDLPNFKIKYGSGYFNNPAGGGDIGLTIIPTPHPSGAQVGSSVDRILALAGSAAQETFGATAAGYSAAGYAAEAGAYGTAGGIAANNAALEGVSGEIQRYQAARTAEKAIGGEAADVGAAGFTMSGSNLLALKSSYQQSYLTDQLIRTQTAINQGGYLEQAAAAGAEQSAALFAGKSATALQDYETKTAATDTTRYTNEANALINTLSSSGALYTSEGLAAGEALQGVPGLKLPQAWNVDSSVFNQLTQPTGSFNPAASIAAAGGFTAAIPR